MNDEEKYEFYKKYKDKKIEFSDDEDFKTIFFRKLKIVQLGDSKYPFIDDIRAQFKYARPRQRIPKFGDKVLAWDEEKGSNIPARCYLMNIGGEFPHVVMPIGKRTDDIASSEGGRIFAVKNAEVID